MLLRCPSTVFASVFTFLICVPAMLPGQDNWEQRLEALHAQNRSLEILEALEQIPAEAVTPAIKFFHFQTLLRLDRNQEALPFLQPLLQREPLGAHDYLLAASWYRHQQQLDEALNYAYRALQEAPESTDAQLMLLELTRDEVDQTGSDLALHRLAALGLRFRGNHPRIEREWLMNLSGWPIQRRIDELTRFCLKYPDDGQAHKYLGCLYVQQAQGQRALAYADRAVELLPRQGNAHLVRANALAMLGRVEDSRAEHDLAIELEPTGISFHARGLFLVGTGNDKEAQADFLQAYRRNRREPRILEEPVKIWLELEEWQAALEFLDQISSLDPTRRAELEYWKAAILADQNQAEAALQSIDTAIELSESPVLTNYARIRRVLLSFRFGRQEAALKELAELEEQFPHDPYVQQARQQLEQSPLNA